MLRQKVFIIIVIVTMIAVCVIFWEDKLIAMTSGGAVFPGTVTETLQFLPCDGSTKREDLTSRNKNGLNTLNVTRILCIVSTTRKNKDRIHAVNCTWLKRCDDHLFMMAEKSAYRVLPNNSDIYFVDIPESRDHLTFKLSTSLKHIYKHYLHKFDWLFKVDDDSYVIVENLRNLLSNYDHRQPGYIGHHFKVLVRNGYMSGGSGFVVSNSGLRQLVERGLNKNICRHDGGDDDVEIGRCLQNSGVPVLSSIDKQGRQSFIPERIFDYFPSSVPEWLKKYSWDAPQKGFNCCSEFVISFHHLRPLELYLFEQLLYNTQVYGRSNVELGNPNWSLDVVAPKNKSAH